MVAANISSARYVRGAASAPSMLDPDALKVSLERDGTVLAQGTGRESLGSQWESLRTLVNLIVDRGGAIPPGRFVLTGKIGDKGSVVPGAYAADYGPLGTVRFTVSACR
jgi:2-keto-4-pentenoate hydratase